MQNSNPLLRIDTSFRSYLNAFTRSFKNHVVGDGALDYAFDADFAIDDFDFRITARDADTTISVIIIAIDGNNW